MRNFGRAEWLPALTWVERSLALVARLGPEPRLLVEQRLPELDRYEQGVAFLLFEGKLAEPEYLLRKKLVERALAA